MTKDFRASQIQTSQIISSGSSSTNAKLVIYDIKAQDQANLNRGLIDSTTFNTNNIGTDTFMYVSGGIGGTGVNGGDITTFGGDIYVSGNLSVLGSIPNRDFDWVDLGGTLKTTSSVAISGDGNQVSNIGADVYFYVSGTKAENFVAPIGDRRAVFRSDTVISGTLSVMQGILLTSASTDLSNDFQLIGSGETSRVLGLQHGSKFTFRNFANTAWGNFLRIGRNPVMPSMKDSLMLGDNVSISSSILVATSGGIRSDAIVLDPYNGSYITAENFAIDSGFAGARGHGSDVFLYVSGTQNTWATSSADITALPPRKVSVFGGDVRISGSIVAGSGSIINDMFDNPNLTSSYANYNLIGGGANNEINSIYEYSYVILQTTPVTSSITSSTNYNTIVVGDNNLIQASNNSFIGSGHLNKILPFLIDNHGIPLAGASSGSFIGAGKENIISGSENSIVAGANNIIEGSIAAGATTPASENKYNFIGAGQKNNIQNSFYAGIVSGLSGMVYGNGSIIGGGLDNTVASTLTLLTFNGPIESFGSSPYSFIGSGIHNKVGTLTGASGIVAGVSGVINGAGSFIGAGYQNTVSVSAGDSGIVAGYSCSLAASNFTAIGAGYKNTIAGFVGNFSNPTIYADNNFIAAGANNSILTSSYCFIGAGISGTLGGYTTGSFIGSGKNNSIVTSLYSSVVGGMNNTIISSGSYSSILCGNYNTISSSNNSVILGGANNLLQTSSSLLYGHNLTSSVGDIRTIQFGSRTISSVDSNPYRFVVSASRGSVFHGGLSGSLTTLTDGTPYLLAGTNVTLSTGSNGAVTINSTGGAGADFDWIDLGGTLKTTSSVAISGDGNQVSNIGTDVYFYASGSKTNGVLPNNAVSVFGGDIHVSGNISNDSGVKWNPTFATTSRTLLNNEYVVGVSASAALKLTLPSIPANGQGYIIKDIGGNATANNITISSSAGKIDGASTYIIGVNYASARIMYFSSLGIWGIV